ncbi:MAG: hypothetical protein HY233_13905 [Acidobacteriales bacterium]|nr:hypothetical protein [Candidatus Koribacter versatilis]MBI3647035.1 hypothetical protein [Terriglobales bacterium]
MKALLCTALLFSLLVAIANAQNAEEQSRSRNSAQAESHPHRPVPESGADDVEQLRADLRRLQGLLNEMRTNLAFVQTSQTPLKHQFELEMDAWQVIVEQMERRLKRMEDHSTPGESQR